MPAFYHWQTHLEITPAERRLMDLLNVQKLYVKYFDIDLDGNSQPVPHAVVDINGELLDETVIVPTVFITHRTFKSISKKNIEQLASRIFKKINEINNRLYPTANYLPTEIQFDCDWTPTTRENYFYFLECFNSKFKTQNSNGVKRHPAPRGRELSSTIRLHQFKYPEQTGVPPVDKGMLMFYNVGNLENWETGNSILEMPTAEKYLTPGTQYPIPLDCALPIFKWGVVFRNGELVYLINNLSRNAVADTSRFFNINKNRYAVKKSTYLKGYYLYKDDLIRLEKIDAALLDAAGAKLAEFQKSIKSAGSNTGSQRTISFYHLDTTTLASFQYEDFKKVIDRF
ncbi:MAG: hypothetical protein AAFZ15_09305 [Bacteroidota bacterium]